MSIPGDTRYHMFLAVVNRVSDESDVSKHGLGEEKSQSPSNRSWLISIPGVAQLELRRGRLEFGPQIGPNSLIMIERRGVPVSRYPVSGSGGRGTSYTTHRGLLSQADKQKLACPFVCCGVYLGVHGSLGRCAGGRAQRFLHLGAWPLITSDYARGSSRRQPPAKYRSPDTRQKHRSSRGVRRSECPRRQPPRPSRQGERVPQTAVRVWEPLGQWRRKPLAGYGREP